MNAEQTDKMFSPHQHTLDGNISITSVEEMNLQMTILALPVIIFIGIIALIGIIGNCVVIYIYSNKYPKCNFKYFVLLLAGIDLISCFILMPLEIVTFLHWFIFPSAFLCKFKSFFNAFTVCASASSLLLIAVDRFRKVCKPHSKQIQPEFGIKLAVMVLCLSAIPATSDAVFWGLHTYKIDDRTNITATMCEKDDKFKLTIWPTLHTIVLYGSTNVIVMVTTLILYICIAVKLFIMPAGPRVTTPEIHVTTPPDDPSDSAAQRESMFKFGSDIESGLSESEDLDRPSSTRISVASMIESDIESHDRYSNTYSLEPVPLRKKKLSENGTVEDRRSVRISMDASSDDNSGRSRDLKVPDNQRRRKTGQCQMRNPKHNKFRRRSTAASLVGHVGTRLRRKTLIMFILTAIFVTTTLLYLSLISYMADSSNFVTTLTIGERTAWLFFLRLYFINSVINPILYGFLDPRFKRALWNMGVRVTWIAGSLKRNIAQSVRRSSSGSNKHAVMVHGVNQKQHQSKV